MVPIAYLKLPSSSSRKLTGLPHHGTPLACFLNRLHSLFHALYKLDSLLVKTVQMSLTSGPHFHKLEYLVFKRTSLFDLPFACVLYVSLCVAC